MASNVEEVPVAHSKGQEARPYKAGIPTAIDVRKLRDAYPDEVLVVGFSIKHEDVASLIGAHPKSERFSTVTTMWRRQVETDTGLVLWAPRNKTYCVANPKEVLTLTKCKTASAVRAVVRSKDLSHLVDRSGLTADEKKQLNHTQMFNGKFLAVAQLRGKSNLPTLEDTSKKGETKCSDTK